MHGRALALTIAMAGLVMSGCGGGGDDQPAKAPAQAKVAAKKGTAGKAGVSSTLTALQLLQQLTTQQQTSLAPVAETKDEMAQRQQKVEASAAAASDLVTQALASRAVVLGSAPEIGELKDSTTAFKEEAKPLPTTATLLPALSQQLKDRYMRLLSQLKPTAATKVREAKDKVDEAIVSLPKIQAEIDAASAAIAAQAGAPKVDLEALAQAAETAVVATSKSMAQADDAVTTGLKVLAETK